MTMIKKQLPRPFTERDWANTPDAVKKAYENLERLVIELLEKQKQLEHRLYQLDNQ